MTTSTALFCAHADVNGDETRCPCTLLTLAQSAVLLDVEPAYLLGMIFDPEVDAERDWHVVRVGGEIYLPVRLVRELLAGGW